MISILLLTCYVYADEFSMLINTEKVDWDKFKKKVIYIEDIWLWAAYVSTETVRY